jgi:hypothetical protein
MFSRFNQSLGKHGWLLLTALVLVFGSIAVTGCATENSEEESTAGSSTDEVVTSSTATPSPTEVPVVTQTPLVEATATPSPTMVDDLAGTPTATSEPKPTLPENWEMFEHHEHGFNIGIPRGWYAVVRPDEILLITNSDPSVPRGSGNILPPNSVDIVIYPNVEPPSVIGDAYSLGVDNLDAQIVQGDPWGYLDWSNALRIFYSVGDSTWLVDARFAETVSDNNHLVSEAKGIINTIRHVHDEPVFSSYSPPPYYDREWAYRARVGKEHERLNFSFHNDYRWLVEDEEFELEEWESRYHNTFELWESAFSEFRDLEPPLGYERFHDEWVEALGWNAGSLWALYLWYATEYGSFEWIIVQIMVRTADDSFINASEYWPMPSGDSNHFTTQPVPFAPPGPQRTLLGPPISGPFLQNTYEQFGSSTNMRTLLALFTPADEAESLESIDYATFTIDYLIDYLDLRSGR